MSLYLDTSVFVALLTDDVFTRQADQYLRESAETVNVSDLGAAEYASVLARRVRTGVITASQALARALPLSTPGRCAPRATSNLMPRTLQLPMPG